MGCIITVSEGHSTTLYVDSGVWWSFEVGLIYVRVLGAIKHCICYVKLGRYHIVIEVRVQEVKMRLQCNVDFGKEK